VTSQTGGGEVISFEDKDEPGAATLTTSLRVLQSVRKQLDSYGRSGGAITKRVASNQRVRRKRANLPLNYSPVFARGRG
jgi:hypothetical protein